MKIKSFEDLQPYIGNYKVMIFFKTKDKQFDEFNTFKQITKSFLFGNELYTDNFFNNSLSILDNLDFHGIQNNFEKDYFFDSLKLEKSEKFFKAKKNSDHYLWRLSSQTCYLMVNRHSVLNHTFSLSFREKEIEKSTESKTCKAINEFMHNLMRVTNYTFITKKPFQISEGYDLYVLYDECDFIECYNDADTLTHMLKKYD